MEYSYRPTAMPSRSTGHKYFISPHPHILQRPNNKPYTVNIPAGINTVAEARRLKNNICRTNPGSKITSGQRARPKNPKTPSLPNKIKTPAATMNIPSLMSFLEDILHPSLQIHVYLITLPSHTQKTTGFLFIYYLKHTQNAITDHAKYPHKVALCFDAYSGTLRGPKYILSDTQKKDDSNLWRCPCSIAFYCNLLTY